MAHIIEIQYNFFMAVPFASIHSHSFLFLSFKSKDPPNPKATKCWLNRIKIKPQLNWAMGSIWCRYAFFQNWMALKSLKWGALKSESNGKLISSWNWMNAQQSNVGANTDVATKEMKRNEGSKASRISQPHFWIWVEWSHVQKIKYCMHTNTQSTSVICGKVW